MTNKDLNTEAAEIVMGWRNVGYVCWVADNHDTIGTDDWSPTTDRNHAQMVLKRVEELGLDLEALCKMTLTAFGSREIWCGWKLLTLDPALITQACVDVVKEVQAEQKAKVAFSRPPVWEEGFPKPATFADEAKEKFNQHLDSYHLQQAQKEGFNPAPGAVNYYDENGMLQPTKKEKQ